MPMTDVCPISGEDSLCEEAYAKCADLDARISQLEAHNAELRESIRRDTEEYGVLAQVTGLRIAELEAHNALLVKFAEAGWNHAIRGVISTWEKLRDAHDAARKGGAIR